MRKKTSKIPTRTSVADDRFLVQDRVLVAIALVACVCTMGFCILEKPWPAVASVFCYGEPFFLVLAGLIAWRLPR